MLFIDAAVHAACLRCITGQYSLNLVYVYAHTWGHLLMNVYSTYIYTYTYMRFLGFPSVSWCMCWQHADRDSVMDSPSWWHFMQNCVLITAHKKCGADSPRTQAKQTVKRRVNNSSLAATTIHHHQSSISQWQTTHALRPDPIILFASILLYSQTSSHHMTSSSFIYFLYWIVPFKGHESQSLYQHGFSRRQDETLDSSPVHQSR